MTTATTDLVAFVARARAWLADRYPERGHGPPAGAGPADDDVSVFCDLSFEGERAVLERGMAFQQDKCDAGFGAISWPAPYGGQGLDPTFEEAFDEVEGAFATPKGHELLSVTTHLVGPTVLALGTESQRDRFVRPFLRAEELCCQLFSEPGAGSDLATLGTRAERDGDAWIVNGSKVWSSGAQFARWGELIARTDPDVVKQAGLTAFLVPLAAEGIEVRPIRQMSGGTSFNEVFLTSVRLEDDLRLGEVGDGWKVALTTLGFERADSGGTRRIGGSWDQVLGLARRQCRTGDPLVRQQLAELYTHHTINEISRQRVAASRRSGQLPGPEGSIGKLAWVAQLDRTSKVVSSLLGPGLCADGGPPGTYSWAAQVLGSPGYHIAGGSDQIQRNIIGERVLGLPAEPRVDRVPWRELPR